MIRPRAFAFIISSFITILLLLFLFYILLPSFLFHYDIVAFWFDFFFLFRSLETENAFQEKLHKGPGKDGVLLEGLGEEFNIDGRWGSSAWKKSLKKLLIGKDEEFNELFRPWLIEILCKEKEAVSVSLLHLLVLIVLKQQAHQLSHYNFVLFQAAALLFIIFFFPVFCSFVRSALRHHRYNTLNPFK